MSTREPYSTNSTDHVAGIRDDTLLNLQTSRQQLAAARTLLRAAELELIYRRAQAERAAIEAAGGLKELGANERDRERAFTLALAEDEQYCEALAEHRTRQAQVDTWSVNVEMGLDLFRTERLDLQQRYVSLWEHALGALDSPPTPTPFAEDDDGRPHLRSVR